MQKSLYFKCYFLDCALLPMQLDRRSFQICRSHPRECASLPRCKRCTLLFFLKISIHSLGGLWYSTLGSTVLLFCTIKFASRSISFGSRENYGSGAIWPITSTFGFSIAFSNAWNHTCLLWYLVWKLAIKKYLSAYFSGQSKEPSIRIFASKPAIISMICLLLIICCISSRYLESSQMFF